MLELTEQVALLVNENTYKGWQSVNISLSLDQIAGSFSVLAVSEFSPGIDPSFIATDTTETFDISVGDRVKVFILKDDVEEQLIITGYIDEVITSYGTGSNSMQISGRSKTADLVDCSYVPENNILEWKNSSVKKIVEDLCSPFGIEVVIDPSARFYADKILESERADEGKKVFEVIKEVCNKVAILPMSYGDGKLYLTGGGTNDVESKYLERTFSRNKAVDSLKTGANVLSGKYIKNHTNRYSSYRAIGYGSSLDVTVGQSRELRNTILPFAEALDPLVTRERPKIILSENIIDFQSAESTVFFEARRRAGLSEKLEYTVVGWTQSDGTIWALNSLIKVEDDYLNVKAEVLLSRVSFIFNSGSGTTTKLTLVDRGTYDFNERATGKTAIEIEIEKGK